MWKRIDKDDSDAIRKVFDYEFPKGEIKELLKGHILCCGAHKSGMETSTSPLNKSQMAKIAYKPDGTIFTVPKDESMEKDINEVLRLNGVRKANGAVMDTSTEILKGRRDAYDRARIMMERLNRKGKCSSVAVKKILDQLLAQEEKEEFIGVKLYYFKRKYDALVKQGV